MTTLQSEDCQTNDHNDSFPTCFEPLRLARNDSVKMMFTGYYNGFNVEVRSTEEMNLLYRLGCYGKGSASRSKPTAAIRDTVKIMRMRQHSKRNYWYKKYGGTEPRSPRTGTDSFFTEVDELTAQIINDSNKKFNRDVIDLVSSDENYSDNETVDDYHSQNTVQSFDSKDLIVIVPNSDVEEDNYFSNLKTKCCVNKIKLKEKLMLTLEEAFFLLYGLGCLQIISNDNCILSTEECWDLFTSADKNFLQRYIVYHYFRSKGYVVKPGIKFGGDYLLYKEGPEKTHADYIVSIKHDDVQVTDTLFILGHVRMAHTTLKEILIAEVIHPQETVKMPRGLREYSVREILITQNIPVANNEDDF